MRLRVFFLLAAAITLQAFAPQAHALTLVAHSITAEPATGSLRFSITFSGAPDLFTVDAYGRQHDEFQYWIVFDPARMNQAEGAPDILVRGGEIPWTGAVVVRNASPRSTDPHGGGWGAVRGTVPFLINGATVSFSVPLSVLGDSDGEFGFFLGIGQWGEISSTLIGVYPNPPVATASSTWGRLKSLYH